jgi:hypothetical protein
MAKPGRSEFASAGFAVAAHAPPLFATDSPTDELFEMEKLSPQNMLAISGADRFNRRGSTCR